MLEQLRILVAEDNPTNRLVAVQMLEALGAVVAVARDGVEALEVLARRSFDLLLVDIEMPRMNGIELIEQVRRPDSAHAGVPVIALTAYVMREHRQAIAAAGADGVIAKPILSIDELGRQILDFAGDRLRPRRGEDAASEIFVGDPGDSRPRGGQETDGAINRATLDALGAAIGRDALSEILEKAVEDIRTTGERIARGLDDADLQDVRGALHILVGLAGAVGAERLEREVRDLQDAIHAGDRAALGPRSVAVDREVSAALADLAAF